MVEILEAFASGDPDAIADRFTEDALLRPSAFITGKPEFHGREEVRQGFAEMERSLGALGERVRIDPLRFFVDGAEDSRVLALCELTTGPERERPEPEGPGRLPCSGLAPAGDAVTPARPPAPRW